MYNYEIETIIRNFLAEKNRILKAQENNEQIQSLKLPIAVAWKRRLNLNKLAKAKEVIDEAIQECQKKYATDEYSQAIKDENGQDIRRIKNQYILEYQKDYNDIMNQETDVDIKKVKIEDLGDLILTDEELDSLAFMIEEEE